MYGYCVFDVVVVVVDEGYFVFQFVVVLVIVMDDYWGQVYFGFVVGLLFLGFGGYFLWYVFGGGGFGLVIGLFGFVVVGYEVFCCLVC